MCGHDLVSFSVPSTRTVCSGYILFTPKHNYNSPRYMMFRLLPRCTSPRQLMANKMLLTDRLW